MLLWGGVVAFHDSLTHPGVTQFVAETIASRKFSQCETLDSKSGLTYLVKSKPDEVILDSDVQASIDRLNVLARRKILPKIALIMAKVNPFVNTRFI